VARTLGARGGAGSRLRAWLRAIRVHQWVKNALLVLPLLASHRFDEPALWLLSGIAFAEFSLGCSAVYVWNDLADLAADRAHPTKRRRPFASGELSVAAGLFAAPLLLGAALALSAAALPARFAAVLGAYVAANIVYTFWLKRVAIADVVLLAAFYTLRVVAGGIAVAVVLSPWLLAFCWFFFLNLAFLKRYADVRRLAEGGEGRAPGRDYEASDLPLLGSMGLASGYLAALILALYVQSENVARLYRSPDLLFAATPLAAYWLSRMWLLAHRGRMDDDPVAFAVRDPVTWAIGLAGAVIAGLATWT
jgi:4-hydroxybenzoate polyprenyltransferase